MPTLAPPAGPSPSALPPVPPATSVPPADGWTTFLGVNDVKGLAFAPEDGALWAATTGGVARWNLADDTYVQYTTADGLASNYVTDVALAPDGTPWFATGSGVSHFDTLLSAGGQVWTTYTTADGLPAGTPQSIAVTPSGEVWVGTTEGVGRFVDGTWTNYLPGTRAWDVAVAPALQGGTGGDVWFANHGAGVSRYSPADDAWTTYTEAGGQPLRGVTALIVGPAPQDGTGGDVFVYENWEGVFRFDGSEWQKAQDHVALVCALAVSPQDVPWIGACGSMHSRFGNLLHAEGDGWTEIKGWHELGQPAIQALAFGLGPRSGAQDTLVVGTEKGIAVRPNGAWRTLRGGPMLNRVTAVAVTPDNAVWFSFGDDQFSAAGGGVSRFDGKRWEYFLDDANVRVLDVAPDGTLWAGIGCGVQRYQDQAWQVVAECGDLGVGNVLDFAFEPNGEVWVATGMNLARYNGESWETFDKLVHEIAVAPASQGGALWALGWEGTQSSNFVARFDGAEWTKMDDVRLSSLAVTSAPLGDTSSALWAMDNDQGLVRFDGESWEQVLGADGLPVHGSLTAAPDGSLWIRGKETLTRFDGSASLTTGGQEWTVYPAAEGIQDMAVTPASQDGTGGVVWLATSSGVIRKNYD